MRMFDAKTQVVQDVKDECEIIVSKEHGAYQVFAARHPTLGKIVIIEGTDGSGIIVETEE
jgi:hypothetical protein